jgi:cytochrome c551/c552
MKRHGFTLKNGGWYMPQKKGKIIGVYGKVEATVTNTEKFDLLAVYAVYPDRKGLNAFVTEQPGIYHSSLIADPNNEDAIPVMFKERTLLMAVGYVDEQAYFIKKSIKANPTLQYRLKLEPVSRSFVQNAINEYDKFPSHSKISKDLDYQWKMVKERKRLKRIEDEWRMMSKLHSLATQGCVNCDEEEAIELSGEVLFNSNCAACHKPKGQLVGPELQGIWDKYASRGETAFLFDFVRNSSKLITEGDPHAVALYDDYGKQQMTAFPTLCDAEIKAILAYTDAWVVE